MIVTVHTGTTSAQGELVRTLPDGHAVVMIGGKEVTGKLVPETPKGGDL